MQEISWEGPRPPATSAEMVWTLPSWERPYAGGGFVPADAGETYGIYTYGGSAIVADIANANYNLRIWGVGAGDNLGVSLASGDFNGDGLADVVAGAPGADGNSDARPGAGEAYVVYGTTLGVGGFYTADMALGQYGLRVIGADADDQLGGASAAGNLNDDGRSDLLVGAFYADGQDNTRSFAG
jgi:hypothetical protein